MKKKTRVFLFAVFLIFSYIPQAVALDGGDPLKLCEAMALFAVEDFVAANKPHDSKSISAFAAAKNDLSYDQQECMANFLIYVIAEKNYYYGVFHIHYSITGKWIKTSEVSEDEWKISYSKNDWKDYWCDFLANSIERYKSELKEQGCE